MIKVSKYLFYGNKVIYVSVVMGNAYMSMHNRNELSDEQAKHKFYNNHVKEVYHLMKEKIISEFQNSKGTFHQSLNYVRCIQKKRCKRSFED